MKTQVKVMIQTQYARIEKTVDTKADAMRYRNEVGEGRKVLAFSITEVQIKEEKTLPEGYQ